METLLTFIVIICIVAVIAIAAYLIHKFMTLKLKQDEPNADQFLQEELDRVLQPIEDEETAEQVSKYKDEEDEEGENE